MHLMNDERGKSIIDHSIFIYQLCWFIYEWAITYVCSCMYGKNRMVNLLCWFIYKCYLLLHLVDEWVSYMDVTYAKVNGWLWYMDVIYVNMNEWMVEKDGRDRLRWDLHHGCHSTFLVFNLWKLAGMLFHVCDERFSHQWYAIGNEVV